MTYHFADPCIVVFGSNYFLFHERLKYRCMGILTIMAVLLCSLPGMSHSEMCICVLGSPLPYLSLLLEAGQRSPGMVAEHTQTGNAADMYKQLMKILEKTIDFYNCVFHARKSFGNVQISKGLEKSWKIIESFILM